MLNEVNVHLEFNFYCLEYNLFTKNKTSCNNSNIIQIKNTLIK